MPGENGVFAGRVARYVGNGYHDRTNPVLSVPVYGAMRKRKYYVYILTNAHHTVLYVGVTNDIRRRLEEHRNGRGSAFTRRYNVGKLVWLEAFDDVNDAIAREKQLKAGSRRKKLDLIAGQNPTWHDYGEDVHRL